MKIFNRFLEPEIINKEFEHLKHINFSLFLDDIPKSQEDLSEINILVLAEPNEYFGLHKWALENKDLFSAILTWDDRILNTCSNSIFLPFGYTWFKPDQYLKNHKKEFKVSHLRGNLLKSYGHQMRWEILDRKDEIKIPTNFYDVYGDRSNLDDARIGKEKVFGNSQYGIAIENFSHRGFFTEKILDCFLLKTIPIYNGCSNIGDFFDKDGIITFNNVDDLIHIVNKLDENYYNSKLLSIEHNYETAILLLNYEKRIAEIITEIFKLNNFI